MSVRQDPIRIGCLTSTRKLSKTTSRMGRDDDGSMGALA
jgi:hypothetical protein